MKIAVDVDDTLCRFAEGLIAHSNEQWGTSLEAGAYSEDYRMLWPGSGPDVVEERIAGFLSSRERISALRPFEEAAPVLASLAGAGHELVVLTSRWPVLEEVTREWVSREFPGVFSEVHFAGIWHQRELPVEQRLAHTKAAACARLGIDVLIDDQLKHCASAAGAGVSAVLFDYYGRYGRYGRCGRCGELPDGVTLATGWREVRVSR